MIWVSWPCLRWQAGSESCCFIPEDWGNHPWRSHYLDIDRSRCTLALRDGGSSRGWDRPVGSTWPVRHRFVLLPGRSVLVRWRLVDDLVYPGTGGRQLSLAHPAGVYRRTCARSVFAG